MSVIKGSRNWAATLYYIIIDYNSGRNFSLVTDLEGEYVFTWIYADSSLYVTFPEKGGDDPQQVLANGYYLIGTINGAASTWDYAALKAEHLFARNEGAEGEEYSLEVTLAENDEIQVVRCDNDNVGAWYPGGEGNNYMVDSDHAGNVIIYFRPNKDGGDDWHHGCIYVAKTQGLLNTASEKKAVKTFVNGQLVIMKGDKVFNALGAQIQ